MMEGKSNVRKGGGLRQRTEKEKRIKLAEVGGRLQTSRLAEYMVLNAPLLGIPQLQ